MSVAAPAVLPLQCCCEEDESTGQTKEKETETETEKEKAADLFFVFNLAPCSVRRLTKQAKQIALAQGRGSGEGRIEGEAGGRKQGVRRGSEQPTGYLLPPFTPPALVSPPSLALSLPSIALVRPPFPLPLLLLLLSDPSPSLPSSKAFPFLHLSLNPLPLLLYSPCHASPWILTACFYLEEHSHQASQGGRE